jgi:hypothetical protein
MLNEEWYIPPRDTRMAGDIAGYLGIDTGAFEKNCDKIIAKSGADLGDNNIYFEWLTPPSDEQLTSLRRKIDNILKPFGNKYIVTNRK